MAAAALLNRQRGSGTPAVKPAELMPFWQPAEQSEQEMQTIIRSFLSG